MENQEFHRLQSVIEIMTQNNQKFIRKTATATGEEELLQQLEFYLTMPPPIAKHYPNIIEYDTNKKPYNFLMPFYEYPTLTNLVLYSSIEYRELTSIIMKVLEFLFDIQHPHITEDPDPNYITNNYIIRVKDRISYMAKLDNLFRDLIKVKYIQVNNTRIDNPLTTLEEINSKPKLLNMLKPDKLFLTHGQLRFDHILIDTNDSIHEEFILLEPRGVNELRDVSYELGKIWQCLRSRILWVEQKEYSIESFGIKKDVFFVDGFSLNLPDKQAMCEKIIDELNDQISNRYNWINKEELIMLAYLAEATHSCAGVPFFYQEKDPSIGLAYFISGALALQKFKDIVD
jgi:hypothetical protein